MAANSLNDNYELNSHTHTHIYSLSKKKDKQTYTYTDWFFLNEIQQSYNVDDDESTKSHLKVVLEPRMGPMNL